MVWDLDLPHEQAWVLMALADCAHDDGSKCFPSVELLAWKCGYSARQAQRVLHKLRTVGLVEVVAYGRGGRQPIEYQLHLDLASAKAPFASRPHGRPPKETGDILSRPNSRPEKGVTNPVKPVTSAVKGVTSRVKRGDRGEAKTSPNRHSNRHIEPSTEPGLTSAVAPPVRRLATDADIYQLLEEFGPPLGADNAREQIELALNHKAYDRARNKVLYLRGWLRREVAWQSKNSGNGTSRQNGRTPVNELSLEERMKRGHQRNLENAERMRRAGIDYEWDDEPYPEEAKQ
jgi:hypothetical protein